MSIVRDTCPLLGTHVQLGTHVRSTNDMPIVGNSMSVLKRTGYTHVHCQGRMSVLPMKCPFHGHRVVRTAAQRETRVFKFRGSHVGSAAHIVRGTCPFYRGQGHFKDSTPVSTCRGSV